MEEGSVRVFIDSLPRIDELIADLGTTWTELLKQESIAVTEFRGADPAAVAGTRQKEPVTVLIASAGVAMALAPAIARVVTAIGRLPIKTVETVLVPVEDSAGNVVRDADGNPILQWIERAKLLETTGAAKSSVDVEGPLGVKVKLVESG